MGLGGLFVSHASVDVGVARELCGVLEGVGFRCWLAPDDVVGGDWAAQIAAAVEGSDGLVVLLSEGANGSAHVAREVTLAIERGRPVIPVRVGEVEPEGALSFLLALAQWVDVFPGGVVAHAQRVVDHIEGVLAAGELVGGDGGGRVPVRVGPPVGLTSFVGREQELAEVAKYLAGARLVTLTGAGGTGKTRLAMEAVGRVGDGEVAWAELAGVDAADLVVGVVARSVGVVEERGKPLLDQLVDGVGGARLLLVLDNCEQVVDGVAEVVGVLLGGCAGVRVLATSRVGLGVAGEVVYRVPPLACPDEGAVLDRGGALRYDAVRLFTERGELVSPSFRLSGDEVGVVVEVCARLDGIPLAIELAAARLAMLSVGELAARLEDRFGLLTGGSRTGLARHQTLEATIDWSYRLLAGSEQTMFQRLAVFSDGFTLEAAERVCSGEGIEGSEVVGLVGALLAQSLLVRSEGVGGSRYRLLETIRVFAAARLVEEGSQDVVSERHAGYYLALAEEAQPYLEGDEQEEWLGRLEADHGNLRTALRWLTDCEDFERAARLAVALHRYWRTRGHWREGLEILSPLLEQANQLPDDLAGKALNSAGVFSFELGDYDRSVAYHQAALERYQRDHPRGVGQTSSELGVIAWQRGDLDEAEGLAQHAATIAETVGDDLTLGRALNLQGAVARNRGDLDRAHQMQRRALDVYRRIGDRRGICIVMNNLGDNALQRGDLDAAETYLISALQAARSLGDASRHPYENLGWLAMLRGDHHLAAHHLHQALTTEEELGSRYDVLWVLDKLSALANEIGRHEQATVILGAAQALAHQMQLPYPDDLPVDHRIATLQAALGEAHYSRLIDQGATMDLTTAIAYALTNPPTT